MTRAGILDAIVVVRKERDARLAALGPKPPWWRPFARGRWRAAHDDIVDEEKLQSTILWREAMLRDREGSS